jgi:adenylate kinase family enzyme
MRIALYGPTGAGKTTIAEALQRVREFHLTSTGEFVRREFPNDPLKGGFSDREKQIREFVEVKIQLPEVILDGFPRHVEQLVWLLGVANEKRYAIEHLFLEVSMVEARRRIMLRGRADMTKFAEQYAAQEAATRVMHEYMENLGITHYHAHGTWNADQLAAWFLRQVETTGPVRSEGC